MNSQNVNISIPSDQLEAVQAYLQTLQIGDPPATVAETPNEQVYDPTFFCGQEYEVKDVIDHKNDGPSWEFLIRWSNGTESWIADDECNCEVFISEYLHRLGINTVYIFCRVSTKNQSRTDCVSLDAQLDELLPLAHQILAHQIGCQRIKVIKISKGAYKKVPKEMLDICEAAQAGDHVLIYRVDRLSRNIFDFLKEIEDLRYRGVTVYSTRIILPTIIYLREPSLLKRYWTRRKRVNSLERGLRHPLSSVKGGAIMLVLFHMERYTREIPMARWLSLTIWMRST